MKDENRGTATLGIVFSVLTYFVFSFHDATIKWLTADTSVWQILFFRSTSILCGCLIFGRASGVRAVAASPLKKALVFRSLMLLAAWLCYYSASRYLQLAELMIIYFCSPVIITLLAVPVLNEKITAVRWIGVFVGLGGVLIAVRPTSLGFSGATILALIAALLWAGSNVLVRKVSLSAGTFLQMFYSNAIFAIATGLALIVFWRPVTAEQLVLMLLVGAFGGAGQILFFEALKRAPASVLAPFEYTALLWAFILGFLIWGDVPHIAVFAGAGLILASGLIILLFDREQRSKAQ